MDREKERKAAKAFGIGTSIYAIVFMVVWCGIAVAIGARFMLIFGIPMLGFVIFRAVMIAKANRKQKANAPWEQPDKSYSPRTPNPTAQDSFCPYCGRERIPDFVFCPQCGRRLD